MKLAIGASGFSPERLSAAASIDGVTFGWCLEVN
jgi:hypothetical protein